MRKEKKIPTIIGLVLLVFSVIGGVYLTGQKTSLFSKASGSCSPILIQVTNITNNSSDISFVSTSPCLSTLSINNQVINDIRFINNNESPVATKIHYFQVKNLKESTEYRFSFINDGKSLSQDDYLFTTAKKPSSPLPTSNLAWGRVLNPNSIPTNNAIVYLNVPGAAPLSSYVSKNGNWSISLASSFDESKSNWFNLPQSSVNEEIVVISEDGSATQVTNDSGLNNPVPDIIIGQNSLVAPVDYQPDNAGQLGKVEAIKSQKNIDITNPKDGETINSQTPDFFGSAPINSKVIIEIHSDELLNGEVTSDSAGSWHWSPPQNLTPGNHTITAKVQDPITGVWQTVVRNFTVAAASNDLAYEASGSANRPTPTEIILPTSTPTLVPTIEEPTSIPLPTDSRAAHPSSASAKPPVSGNFLPTLIVLTSASLFIFVSVFLLK